MRSPSSIRTTVRAEVIARNRMSSIVSGNARKRIGIYREFSGNTTALGGAEFCVATLAEAFEADHDVEIINHQPNLTAERFREVFGISLRRTRFRLEQRNSLIPRSSRMPWDIYADAKHLNAQLSKEYDVFVCITHSVPPFCHSRLGLLMVLFPERDRNREWPWYDPDSERKSLLFTHARKALYGLIWDRRFASYQQKAANSDFTRGWTKRRWGIDCDVIYPPVNIPPTVATRRDPMILSIGRITPPKKQLPLIRRFASMVQQGLAGWTFACLGSLANKSTDRDYLDEMRLAIGPAPVEVVTDASRDDLDARLARASIFWHATGLGEDQDVNPLAMEHFGISTVEAMAHGCVPVVINKGGQPEIVRHGVDGFLWDTLEELEHYTSLLAGNAELRRNMAHAARQRALRFSKERFVAETANLCGFVTQAITEPS
jgi:L-malate glycosyltransferase